MKSSEHRNIQSETIFNIYTIVISDVSIYNAPLGHHFSEYCSVGKSRSKYRTIAN
jgi:hypothetical protein